MIKFTHKKISTNVIVLQICFNIPSKQFDKDYEQKFTKLIQFLKPDEFVHIIKIVFMNLVTKLANIKH